MCVRVRTCVRVCVNKLLFLLIQIIVWVIGGFVACVTPNVNMCIFLHDYKNSFSFALLYSCKRMNVNRLVDFNP